MGRWPSIVPPNVDYSAIGSSALERAEAARPFTGPSPYEGLGSNNWVVAGSRTTTGRPLLANDMHLLLSIPAIWYAGDSPPARVQAERGCGPDRSCHPLRWQGPDARAAGPQPVQRAVSDLAGAGAGGATLALVGPGTGLDARRGAAPLLALRKTVDWLKAELGPRIEGLAWGKLHKLTHAHTLGSVKPLDTFSIAAPTLWAETAPPSGPREPANTT